MGVQELFSKLRFSYIEQVTKEKFLRAIVGDPPQVIEHYENVELEAQLVHAKVGLKAKKLEVDGMVEKLETRGRELSRSNMSSRNWSHGFVEYADQEKDTGPSIFRTCCFPTFPRK